MDLPYMGTVDAPLKRLRGMDSWVGRAFSAWEEMLVMSESECESGSEEKSARKAISPVLSFSLLNCYNTGESAKIKRDPVRNPALFV